MTFVCLFLHLVSISISIKSPPEAFPRRSPVRTQHNASGKPTKSPLPEKKGHRTGQQQQWQDWNLFLSSFFKNPLNTGVWHCFFSVVAGKTQSAEGPVRRVYTVLPPPADYQADSQRSCTPLQLESTSDKDTAGTLIAIIIYDLLNNAFKDQWSPMKTILWIISATPPVRGK